MVINGCNVEISRQGRELKEHGTPLFPVACYRDNLAEIRILWHWHDELEAVVVEEGAAAFSVDGEVYALGQGEGIFVNAGALHSGWAAGAGVCRLQSIVFHPRLVGGSMDSIFWQGYVRPLLADAARPGVCLRPAVPWEREAVRAIQETWQACFSEPPGYEFMVRSALSRLVFLLSGHRAPLQEVPSEKAVRNGERIKVMLQYIQENCGGELTTASIAQSAAVSTSECLRCFRDMTGTTPIQYVKQLRIQRAAELLLSTEMKIADIGAQCGFQEMSYFARTFRALKGSTPSEYRRQKKSWPL